MRPYLVDALAPWIGRSAALLIAPTWFSCAALAGLLAGWLAIRNARRCGEDAAAVAGACVWAYIAALLAGVLACMIGDVIERAISGQPVRLRWAGMTSFWGFAGGLVAASIALAHHPRLSLGRFGDLVAAPLGVAIVLARLGCFVAGCDYGEVSSLPWAVRFPGGSSAWHAHVSAGLLPAARPLSLPVHPTQLYEALLGMVLIGAAHGLGGLAWVRKVDGRLFLICAGIYCIGRWLIELLRGDIGRGFLGPLSHGQLFCLVAGAATLLALWRCRRVAVAIACALALMAAGESHVRAQSPQAPQGPQGTQAQDAQPVPPAEVPRVPAAAGEASPQPVAASAPARRMMRLGLYLGASDVLNRPAEQIPALGGVGVFLAIELWRGWLVGGALDSMSNELASHQALAIRAMRVWPLRGQWQIALSGALGTMLVDFEEPAFVDVRTIIVRGGSVVEWAVSERLVLSFHPLELELMPSTRLGGPLVSYQVQVGAGYRFAAPSF